MLSDDITVCPDLYRQWILRSSEHVTKPINQSGSVEQTSRDNNKRAYRHHDGGPIDGLRFPPLLSCVTKLNRMKTTKDNVWQIISEYYGL